MPGKVFLIVDGHPVHKAKKVKEFTENEEDGRLKIFFLPPYSPDLNPMNGFGTTSRMIVSAVR